jgi:hypothetical protein
MGAPFAAIANHQRLDAAISAPALLMSSLINASAAAAASFVFGRTVGWFWGY